MAKTERQGGDRAPGHEVSMCSDVCVVGNGVCRREWFCALGFLSLSPTTIFLSGVLQVFWSLSYSHVVSYFALGL